jgi:hypothetical protein
MNDQHTRGMVTTRHRSLVERGRSKAFVRDKGLAHTQKRKKKSSDKTCFHESKEKDSPSEHIELPAKLLDYFLRSNKSNINQSFSGTDWKIEK